jgi:hypothetical protein
MYNNRDSIVKLTGRRIKNADVIYVNQVLYIPLLPNQPQPPKKINRKATKPKRLNDRVHKINVPFASACELGDLPLMVYEDLTIKATIKMSGRLAVRLAHKVPLIHVTNRGLETILNNAAARVVNQLVGEAEVKWDKATNRITYQSLLITKSKTPNAPSTAVGLAIASDKPTPVLRCELSYPNLSGHINNHFYVAKQVKVIIDVEPKVPPVTQTRERMATDLVPDKVHVPSNRNDVAWQLISEGALIISATILTDFLFGVGIFDDVVTIPLGLSRIGCGTYRLLLPVLSRSVGAFSAKRAAQIGTGMALKAAHAD